MEPSTQTHDALCAKLADSGLRATRQREVVYNIVLGKRDHPTAEEIFARVKLSLPGISLATVYNCLETLSQCGLVRPVHFEREPTRYCTNLREHAHFHDDSTGHVHDIELPADTTSYLRHLLPRGFEASSIELSFRGHAATR
ncbi:MAG: transcriptional repressor [Opitutaceae bacterium]|jgi:Fur family peroxide stress response transcriptional regulator